MLDRFVQIQQHSSSLVVFPTTGRWLLPIRIAHLLIGILAASVYVGCPTGSAQDATHPQAMVQARFRPSDVPTGSFSWQAGSFWGQRLTACREGTLPTMSRLMLGTERSHFVQNFRIAAGQVEGRHRGPKWNDGDTYKWLEALSLMYLSSKDADLLQLLNEVIAVISAAQREDGYLHTPVIIANRNGQTRVREFGDPVNFEMYNMGHLMTAACVHFEATHETTLLSVACKAADFLDRVFQNPTPEMARHAVCPAHYMGIMDLYRTTGDERYLTLASRWMSMRNMVQGGDDNQDRIPFFEQREAVGHAVRANYLYAGAADLFLETGDRRLMDSLDACWSSVQNKKLYVTGGCGALYDGASPDGSNEQSSISRVHQAYGRNYQLPNSTAHNETCAAIGNVLWNHRMWQISSHAKYIDALENSLYNAVLSGVSLDGTRFFYTNTLRQLNEMPVSLRWPQQRQEWISCYCCPPNVARLVAGVDRLSFAVETDQLWLLLYGASSIEQPLPSGETFSIRQETDYPYDGRIRIVLQSAPDVPFRISMRIPGWCSGASITINDQPHSEACQAESFVHLKRRWQKGDCIELKLEMPIQLLRAHPLVEECTGQVAVRRGPLVYCLESSDLPEGSGVQQARISPDQISDWKVQPGEAELVGVTVLRGPLWLDSSLVRLTTDSIDQESSKLYDLYQPVELQSCSATLVPYFAWGNRALSEMTVWIPTR